MIVSAGFVWALRHGHIGSNPAQGLKLHAPDNRRELWWTAEECREVLDACTDNVRPFVRLLLLTGMRRGEAAQMEWTNFDPAGRTLEVTAEVSKTHEARTVHLTDAAQELVLSLNPFSGGRIFKRTDGGRFSEDYLRDALNKIRRTLGHKRATKLLPKGSGFHITRHTYITHALASGANITNLGKQVGQRSADITSRYAHAIPQAVRETAEAVGRALAV
ncbi:MAG: site-specific integrase [Planctomycetota bacterium]|nr:site-specific integrase [Planctomycetota bacterium]